MMDDFFNPRMRKHEPENIMILGEGQTYSLNCYETKLNNNVMVVGSPGAGKTRGIVTPNLLQATGSYVISDPKGSLYEQWSRRLLDEDYDVYCVDFTHPEISTEYNPFRYVRTDEDCRKMAHVLMDSGDRTYGDDPFWQQSSELLVQSMLMYLLTYPMKERTFHNLMTLIGMWDPGNHDASEATLPIDVMMERLENKDDSTIYRLYKKVRAAADKTLRSIQITVSAHLSAYDTPALKLMMDGEGINFANIGAQKTAVFVVVSDTDRSMDTLANIFFTQAMQELCKAADLKPEHKLDIPVRFIMDDFATNVRIAEFPRMIASIRSRGISTMLMVQAESQLDKGYGDDSGTIIGSCDTYVYMGGNDIETAKHVAERCDQPLRKVLNMPVGKSWIFRRGQEPVLTDTIDLNSYLSRKEQELGL